MNLLTPEPFVYPCGCVNEMNPATMEWENTRTCGNNDHPRIYSTAEEARSAVLGP